MIDCQIGNSEYSNAVLEVLSESLKLSYIRKKRREKRLRHQKRNSTDNIITTPQE